MITIEETESIYQTLLLVYEGDKKLLMQYHYMSPASMSEAASWTTDYIVHGTKQASFFRILSGGKTVGCVCMDSFQAYDLAIRHDSRVLLPDVLREIRNLEPKLATIRLFKEDYRTIKDLVVSGLATKVRHEEAASQIILKIK